MGSKDFPFATSVLKETEFRHAAEGRQKCSGAGEGIRTLDPNLGKVVLYP